MTPFETFLWIVRLLVAGILFQTLFFKFTGASESVYIFSTLGAEPWGRIGSGLIELVAALMVLYPPTTALGSLVAAGVMSGALLAHLTKLGIEVQGDKGLLFILGIVVFAGSALLLLVRRHDLPLVGTRLP